MAMYEQEGFCPHNSFLHYHFEVNYNVPEIWRRTSKLLGDRTAYMVYTKSGNNFNGWCYVVDCLMGAESSIGVEIASLLQTWIPQCEYARTGRKILVTDVINPYQIPHLAHCYFNGEQNFTPADDTLHVFEDARYVCGVIDEGEHVHMYFYKKR